MRRFFPVFLIALVMIPGPGARPLAAQEPAPQSQPQAEAEDLHEEFIRSRGAQGESHASGGRPDLGPVVLGNPTQAVTALRVGLHTTAFSPTGTVLTEFSSLHHPSVELTNTDGDVKVVDRATGKQIAVMAPGMLVRVEHDGQQFLVSQDGLLLGSFDGPVLFRPTSRDNFFRVEHIRRVFSGTHVPRYRGAMEVGRGPTTAGLSGPPRVNLFNIVEVEQYVPGVVANESIASFAVEALKAQAVAARGYAIANLGNYVRRGYPFDIVDSAASQVYRGVISEHVNAVRASSDTLGLVASSGGRIIAAMYSSSFGGHSEHNEAISFVAGQPAGGAPVSYLRGIYDGTENPPDFSQETGIAAFWRSNPPLPMIHDECSWTGNTFSRWNFPLPATLIKSRLTDSNATRIAGDRTGTISDIAITGRGAGSQRATVVRITFANPHGIYEVRGWQGIRSVIGRTASPSGAFRACNSNPALPPAVLPGNFTLNNPSWLEVTRNPDGTVNQVRVWGGGWGHNLGMSQYGAHGRGRLGQSFIEILKAYYTGVEIGSFPIDIGRSPGSGPPVLRQQFVAPNARGVLEIRARDLAGLNVHLNERHDLRFDQATLASGLVQVDVSPYLVPGVNVIQYNPVGRNGTATVNVVLH